MIVSIKACKVVERTASRALPDPLGKVRACDARQSSQPLADGRRQLSGRLRRAGAQIDQAARQRKQILDAVIHLPKKQLLVLLRLPPLGDVAGDLGCTDDFASGVSLIGETDNEISTKLPSLRRRTVS